jgi:hypothetical protein
MMIKTLCSMDEISRIGLIIFSPFVVTTEMIIFVIVWIGEENYVDNGWFSNRSVPATNLE